jgi:hypothetical protein
MVTLMKFIDVIFGTIYKELIKNWKDEFKACTATTNLIMIAFLVNSFTILALISIFYGNKIKLLDDLFFFTILILL